MSLHGLGPAGLDPTGLGLVALGPDELRIGGVVAIPEPFRSQLAAARARFGDPAANLVAPHITLLGPTVVRTDDLDVIDEHLSAVAARHQTFGARLAGSATFRPVSPVVFVQVVEGAEACARLVDDLLTGPLALDPRFPYHPHVTVAQGVTDDLLDAAQTDMASFSAGFPVAGFSRYEHGTDGVWHRARTFALTP